LIACFKGFRIREYVGIGKLARLHDETAIYEALSSSGLADVLNHLPEGLDTKIGQLVDDDLCRIQKMLGLPRREGHKSSERDGYTFKTLSGGQLQKLDLAQTFMRIVEAGLLILDEPSSNLDPEAEFELMKTIKVLRAGRSTIFSTHRLNTVWIADKVLVLENGRIVESGTYGELLTRPDGRFRYLHNLQNPAIGDVK
jgi:ATP-binding cassette subfamily B protein